MGFRGFDVVFKMITTLGITGPIAAGKGMAADILKQKGYLRFSLTDELRKEVKRQRRILTREIFLDVADSLRKRLGNEILAKRTIEQINLLRTKGGTEKVVIEGLKNPGEIIWLKKNYNLYLIGIVASEQTRLKRLIKRASDLDISSTPAQIKTQMERDLGVGQEKYGNNIASCLALADVTIENNGSLIDFEKKLSDAARQQEI